METIYTTILKSLYTHHSLSIADISKYAGKSIPIITKAVQKLTNDEFIIIDGQRASTGGRRAIDYKLNKDKIGYIATITIDRYAVFFAIYDFSNTVIGKTKKVSIHNLDDYQTFDVILSSLKELLDPYTKKQVMSIGITTPGFVDSITAVNNTYPKSSPLYDLAKRINLETNIQTFIENDSSAIAIAEKKFGNATLSKHALVINLTWGVGLGILIDGELFRGNDGFAGEFSHIPLANESKLCSCGKKGCIEVEASLESAIDYIQEQINNGEVSTIADKLNLDNKAEIFQLLKNTYDKGDQLCIHAIKKIGYMLGKGIATLIHILNPETVIISGIGATFGKILLPEIQSAVQIYCIPRLAQRTTIKISNTNNIQKIASACIAVLQNKELIKH